jgi:hypothetical protein
MKIHPAADLFPMMTEDELQELAADIAANGLVHPIILDDQKQLIDGRNRLAACQIAKVEPRFEQLNGRDPLAYIVSANLARRNLTKGQQAMLAAMIYPEPERGRGKKDPALKLPESGGFKRELLRQARFVLRHSQAFAEAVAKSSMSLDDALSKVQELKQQATSTEAKLERLRTLAPDLAARVADENLSLTEALAIPYQREEDLRRVKEAGREAAKSIFGFAAHVASIHCAIDAGEDIRISPDTLKTLKDAFHILLNDMQEQP